MARICSKSEKGDVALSIFEAMGEALGNAVEKIGETAENSNFKEQLIDLDKPLNFNDPETDSDASDFNRSGDANINENGSERGETIESDRFSPEKIKIEYDDNGNPYKVNNELVPSNEYEINGYKYSTDEFGRIENVSGELRLTERPGRMTINESMDDIGKGDAKDTDDKGHLIGDRFDGSNKLENLVPMDSNLNRGEFKAMENQWAKALEDGKEVNVSITPEYSGDSFRPDSFIVKYTIDGETSVKVFEN